MNPILASFYKFFKAKNALSPETAITLTKEEFLELGLPDGFKWYFGLPIIAVIQKTKGNKYWFSVNNYENNNRNTIVMSLIIIAISSIVIFMAIGFFLLINGYLK